MKEIIVYNNHNTNLSSIKPVEHNYLDKVYMFNLIKNLFTLTKGALFVHARIHNYYLATSVVNQLNKIDSLITSGYKFSEISFTFKEEQLDNNLLDILCEVWFAYEQVVFCYLIDKETDFIKPNSSWSEITSESPCFAMFKGMEEDVIWIGKSDNLKFPFVADRVFK